MEALVDVDLLIEKKRSLEIEIEHEVERPNPDSIRLADLKKQKLRIKEQIGRLNTH